VHHALRPRLGHAGKWAVCSEENVLAIVGVQGFASNPLADSAAGHVVGVSSPLDSVEEDAREEILGIPLVYPVPIASALVVRLPFASYPRVLPGRESSWLSSPYTQGELFNAESLFPTLSYE